MSTILPFCPKCESLMNYTKSELICSLCDYKEDIKSKSKLRSTVYKSDFSGSIDPSIIYDEALRRTTKIKCTNMACPSNDIKQWGKRTAEGFLIQRDMVISNYHDRDDRVNTYVCRICKMITLPKITTTKLLEAISD
jgi:DNA-directed RNA polymerase subunit M/transcription elongation factor TFIIS